MDLVPKLTKEDKLTKYNFGLYITKSSSVSDLYLKCVGNKKIRNSAELRLMFYYKRE